MAVTETRSLPAPFIEELGKDYAKQITALTATPIDTSKFETKVAGKDALQTQAQNLATQGVGSFAPFLQQAQTAGTAAGTSLGGVGIGATAYQQGVQDFMSPYQQDVIDVTLSEFDRQRQIQEQAIRDQAVSAGAFGGGREGVQLAEFGTGAARERALLQAGLQQQGFQQAQQAAARAQQQQLGLATLVPGLQREQIGTLGQVGSIQQAQEQAQLEAQTQAARAQAMEPYERLGFYGSGVTGLMGGYQGQYQFSSTPSASPLQTALGIGSTIAGLYGGLRK